MVYIGHYPNIPFDIPRNWIWVELGKIGRWQSGSTPNRLNKAYYGGNIPWLKTGDLNDGYITHIPEYITEKALNETSVKLNPIGSVLIAMYGATIGKIGILTFAATTNQACCACDVFEGIEKEYLFFESSVHVKSRNILSEIQFLGEKDGIQGRIYKIRRRWSTA